MSKKLYNVILEGKDLRFNLLQFKGPLKKKYNVPYLKSGSF